MNKTLISVGKAQLKVVGLNPKSVSHSSTGRVPGRATFSGMDYQLTGLGEKITTIEANTMPQIFGGLDALGWLIAHHESQAVVNYIRMGPNYLGTIGGSVVIRDLQIDEDAFHPFTGVGRKVDVSFDLVHVGAGMNASQLAGSSFGGLF